MLLIMNNNKIEEKQILSKISHPELNAKRNSLDVSAQKDFFKGIIKVINSSSDPLNYKVSFKVFIERISYLQKNPNKKYNTQETIFDSSTPFDDDLEEVLPKIVDLLKSDGRKLMLALLYLESVLNNLKIVLNEYNLVKLVVTSMIIVGKFYDDLFNIDIPLISKLLGIECADLQEMEMEFLFALDFKLDIQTKELNTFTRKVVGTWINKIKNNI